MFIFYMYIGLTITGLAMLKLLNVMCENERLKYEKEKNKIFKT